MKNLLQPELPVVLGGTAPGVGIPAAPIARNISAAWLALLAVIAAAVWLPLGAYWRSDDFLAVHYASELGRALSDFTHNQYDLSGVVWFYRPLVTLSFWIEQAIAGGPNPLVSFSQNLALHVIAVLLVASIGTRAIGARAGFLAALVWACVPAHDHVVWWAVGRVDSMATVCMLLSVRAFLRRLDDPARSQAPWLLWFILGLLCKESALALPGVLVVAGIALSAAGSRMRTAWRVAPAILVLVTYFAIRHLVLGRLLGGYQTATPAPFDALRGWASALGRVLAPYWHDASTTVYSISHGFGPILLGVLAVAVLLQPRARRALPFALAAFVCLSVPLAPLLSQLDAPSNQRLLYAALIPLTLVIGTAGPIAAAVILIGFVPVHIERREQAHAAWQTTASMHSHLIALSNEEARVGDGDADWFVAGVPRTDQSERFVLLHLAVDRLLQPPFVPSTAPRRIFALRPLDGRADAFRLPYGDTSGLPFAAPTFAFDGPGILARLPSPASPKLEVQFDGPEQISTGSFLALHERRIAHRFLVRHAPTGLFRVTTFTAGGYVTAIVPGEAFGERQAIDLTSYLTARYVDNENRDSAHVLFAFGIATTFDLDLRFPVLIESGEWRESASRARVFHALAAASEPVWLTFDRGVAEFLAGGR